MMIKLYNVDETGVITFSKFRMISEPIFYMVLAIINPILSLIVSGAVASSPGVSNFQKTYNPAFQKKPNTYLVLVLLFSGLFLSVALLFPKAAQVGIVVFSIYTLVKNIYTVRNNEFEMTGIKYE